jgi:hypothetical protein
VIDIVAELVLIISKGFMIIMSGCKTNSDDVIKLTEVSTILDQVGKTRLYMINNDGKTVMDDG